MTGPHTRTHPEPDGDAGAETGAEPSAESGAENNAAPGPDAGAERDTEPSARVDPNQPVIDEFRANGGRVGGMFEGADLLLLTTRGRRSGRSHTTPLGYLRDGHRLLVFGSNAGQDTHPAWFHNVLASPRVTVEVPRAATAGATAPDVTDPAEPAHPADPASDIEEFTGTAIPLEGEERDRLYAVQAERVPPYAAYQAGTARVIPVVALLRLDFAGDPERARAAGRQLLAAHADLRAQLARLRGDTPPPNTGAIPPQGIPGDLAAHCLAFCSALGTHHDGEGTAFAAIEAAYPELKLTLDQLRDDHRLVIDGLRTIEALARRIALGEEVPTLRAELDTLAEGLERHFAFEEAELLPVLGL